MNNKKIVFFCVFIVFIIVTLFYIKHRETEKKVALARQTQKAMGRLMFDLRQSGRGVLQGVPADGRWYNCKNWLVGNNISCLSVRRQKEAPDILDLQVETKKDVSLKYEIRVRVKS